MRAYTAVGMGDDIGLDVGGGCGGAAEGGGDAASLVGESSESRLIEELDALGGGEGEASWWS